MVAARPLCLETSLAEAVEPICDLWTPAASVGEPGHKEGEGFNVACDAQWTCIERVEASEQLIKTLPARLPACPSTSSSLDQ